MAAAVGLKVYIVVRTVGAIIVRYRPGVLKCAAAVAVKLNFSHIIA
jgi:hypothetical protein